MRESSILKATLLALHKEFHPGIFWRQNAGRIQTAAGHWIDLGPEGIADIVGFIPTPAGARVVFVETKTRRGKQRESQERFQAAVERAGGIYVLARSPREAVEGVRQSLKTPDPDTLSSPAPSPPNAARSAGCAPSKPHSARQ